ncbi:MAG: hypothetical protein WBD90_10180 [Xanthobacteraceae bacterium]|jgi:hypothetical protein
MTPKIAASRRNGRHSRGPVSAAGKKIASRNALRHGLTAMALKPAASLPEIETFSKALCGTDPDPALAAIALTIAKGEMALRAIRAQKLAAVERLRDATTIALAKGDNSLAVGRGRFLQSWLFDRELKRLVPMLMEKYKDQMPPPLSESSTASAELNCLEVADGMVPIQLKALLKESEPSVEDQATAAQKVVEYVIEERDEHDALTEALSDLRKLDRYERQAWSRQLRAYREFMSVKLVQRLRR